MRLALFHKLHVALAFSGMMTAAVLAPPVLCGAGCGGDGTTGGPGTTTSQALTFEGDASGSQATPPTASQASANIKLSLSADGTQLTYTLQNGLAGATAVEIDQGQMGAAGDALFTLKGDAMSSGTLQVSAAQAAALKAGEFYLNVASPSFPSGEIRRRSWRAMTRRRDSSRLSGTTQFSANLSGLQGVPPISLAGAGTATLTLDEKTGQLSYQINHTLSAATAVVIKQGGVGLTGDVVFSLMTAANGGALPAAVTGTQMLDASQRLLLKSGLLYVEMQSALNGTLRGQILAGKTLPFAVALKAAPLVLTSASGTAVFVLSQDGANLAFRLSHNAQGVTGAAIVKPGIRRDVGVPACRRQGRRAGHLRRPGRRRRRGAAARGPARQHAASQHRHGAARQRRTERRADRPRAQLTVRGRGRSARRSRRRSSAG